MAGEDHFIDKPCAECCAQPGCFAAKMAVEPELVSVRGGTGKHVATKSKIDGFRTAWKRKIYLYIWWHRGRGISDRLQEISSGGFGE